MNRQLSQNLTIHGPASCSFHQQSLTDQCQHYQSVSLLDIISTHIYFNFLADLFSSTRGVAIT